MSENDTTATTTITLEVEHELDEVHAPAWEELVAMSPDEATAREQLAARVEAAADIDNALYQLYREREQQQQQAAAQLLGEGMSIGQPPGGGGDGGSQQ